MKKAKDLMGHDITSVGEDAPLKEAAKLLDQRNLSGVPVVNNKDEVVGFISEKDIVAAQFPESVKMENTEIVSFANISQVIKKMDQAKAAVVKDYMSKILYCVQENSPLAEVIELMLEKNLKRIPVVRDKHLVGVIERASLSRIASEEK